MTIQRIPLALLLAMFFATGCTLFSKKSPQKDGDTPPQTQGPVAETNDPIDVADNRGSDEPGDDTSPNGSEGGEGPESPEEEGEESSEGPTSEKLADVCSKSEHEAVRTYKKIDDLTEANFMEKVNAWVAQDQAARGEEASNYRYTYIPLSFLKDPKEANYARIGVSKAMNSVGVAADKIVSPEEASDGHGIVYALYLPSYWGERASQKWGYVAGARAAQVFSPAPRLSLRAFDGDKPVGADRLTYNSLHGGVYIRLIDVPSRGQGDGATLKRQMGVRNKKPTHKLMVRNAITHSPRYVQRFEKEDGTSYWESMDDFYSRNSDLIYLRNRGRVTPSFRGDGMLSDFGTVASEAYQMQKKGSGALPLYYIFGNANQNRSKAEQAFVRDPLNHRGGDLLNGHCVYCHIGGVQEPNNDMWTAIEEEKLSGQRLETARAFWTSNDELKVQYAKDREHYQNAMCEIVLGISDGDEEFNRGVVTSTDEREPAFFVSSTISGSRLRGDTTGKRLGQPPRGRR